MMRMNKKGFNFIELVMVIVILGIVFSGLAVAVTQAVKDTFRPEVISVATALAEQEAEKVTQLSFANVVDQNRDAPLAYAGDYSQYGWEVRVDSIDTAQPNLGTDVSMATYKFVEIRIHNAAIGYLSVKTLKANY